MPVLGPRDCDGLDRISDHRSSPAFACSFSTSICGWSTLRQLYSTSHQEDTLAQYALSLCPGELQDSLRLTQLTAPGALKKAKRSASSPVSSFAFFNQPNEQGEESARGWEPSQSSSAGEVAFFGIFDG